MTSASMVLVPREDPIGKIVFAVVVLAFGLVCFVALITVLAAVLRGPTARCRARLEEAPVRVLLTGLVGYGALSGLAAYLFSGAFITRLLETEIVMSWLVGGSVAVAVLVVVTLLGAPGTVAALGDRLAILHGRPIAGLPRSMLATTLAVLAGWFPVVGWFVVTPALLLLSFGTAASGLVPRRRGRRSESAAGSVFEVEDNRQEQQGTAA